MYSPSHLAEMPLSLTCAGNPKRSAEKYDQPSSCRVPVVQDGQHVLELGVVVVVVGVVAVEDPSERRGEGGGGNNPDLNITFHTLIFGVVLLVLPGTCVLDVTFRSADLDCI